MSEVHSVSTSDDLIGALWAVIATIFVYRETHQESVSAAITRASATLVSFVLCLVYLLLFPFHAVGMAVLIGLGAFLLMAIGRDGDIVIAGITTSVVMVSAALSPHNAWEQPILRLVDTAVGIAVALCASSLALKLARRAHLARRRGGLLRTAGTGRHDQGRPA